MKVTELNKEQLTELKQAYFAEREEITSYSDLAEIDELVSDAEVFEHFKDTFFSEYDFNCSKPKLKYLTRSNDSSIYYTAEELEDVIKYFAFSPEEIRETFLNDCENGAENVYSQAREMTEYNFELLTAQSLEEIARVYNSVTDLLFDGSELIVKEI